MNPCSKNPSRNKNICTFYGFFIIDLANGFVDILMKNVTVQSHSQHFATFRNQTINVEIQLFFV